MAMSQYQNAGRSHNRKINNSCFERVEELKYVGRTLMNQNSIQEKIKIRLKLRNACYHSVIKSRRMRWAGNVALMGERGGAFRVLVGNPEGRDQLEDRGIDGRIILNWIFRNWDGGMDWIDLAQNRDS